jgi:single-strand DNA-binding protein
MENLIMANFNKIIIAGRLTADPELKQTQGGNTVATFSVAVNRRKSADCEQVADFFNVVAWRNTAEFICKHFRKGRAIIVCGRLQNRSWEDDKGAKRYTTEIVADEVDFADSKNDGTVSSAPASVATEEYVPDAYAVSTTKNPITLGVEKVKFEEVNDDGGLPF